MAYAASGLPTGLTIDAASGIISGHADGSRDVHRDRVSRPTSSRTPAARRSRGPSSSRSSAGPPSLSKLGFGNVGKGKAKVSFALAQGSSAPAIRSFTISLPKGLSFARKAKTLSKHISLKGARYTLKLSGGVLTITLKKPRVEGHVLDRPSGDKGQHVAQAQGAWPQGQVAEPRGEGRRRRRQRHQAVRQAQGLGRRAQTGWLGAATAPYSSGRRSPCRSANSVNVLLRVAAMSTSAIAHPSSSAVAMHPS